MAQSPRLQCNANVHVRQTEEDSKTGSVDGLEAAFQQLTVAVCNEGQLRSLKLCAMLLHLEDGSISDSDLRQVRNRYIHSQEDRDHKSPKAFEDILLMEPSLRKLEVEIKQPSRLDDALSAVATVRLFDFYRESYYMLEPLDDGESLRVKMDECPSTRAFLSHLLNVFPRLCDDKQKNQYRNFICYDPDGPHHLWAKGLINSARSLEEAMDSYEKEYRRRFKDDAKLKKYAEDSLKRRASSLNIGQALHQFKSQYLKVREHHPRERVIEAVKAVMKGAGSAIVFNFAQGVLDTMGCIYVSRLNLCKSAQPTELKVVQVQKLDDLPDIGNIIGMLKDFYKDFSS